MADVSLAEKQVPRPVVGASAATPILRSTSTAADSRLRKRRRLVRFMTREFSSHELVKLVEPRPHPIHV